MSLLSDIHILYRSLLCGLFRIIRRLCIRALTMCALMPLFKHRRCATFPVPAPVSPVMSPARTPEEEAESDKYEEEGEQRAKTAEAVSKSEWTVERHPISIVRIRRGHRVRVTRGRFDGDGRTLGNTSLKGKECDACNRSDQHQSRDDT